MCHPIRGSAKVWLLGCVIARVGGGLTQPRNRTLHCIFSVVWLYTHVTEDPDDDNDGVLDEDEDDDEHDEMWTRPPIVASSQQR